MRRPLYLSLHAWASSFPCCGGIVDTHVDGPHPSEPPLLFGMNRSIFRRAGRPPPAARSLSKHAAALAGEWGLGCVNPRTIAHASIGRGLYRARSPRGRKERGRRRRRSPRKDLVPSLEGGEIATRRIIREIWASSTHNHRKGFRGRVRSSIQETKILVLLVGGQRV